MERWAGQRKDDDGEESPLLPLLCKYVNEHLNRRKETQRFRMAVHQPSWRTVLTERMLLIFIAAGAGVHYRGRGVEEESAASFTVILLVSNGPFRSIHPVLICG